MHLLFQLANLPGQRWLGDVQASRRLTEMRRIAEREEIANPAKIQVSHNPIIRVRVTLNESMCS